MISIRHIGKVTGFSWYNRNRGNSRSTDASPSFSFLVSPRNQLSSLASKGKNMYVKVSKSPKTCLHEIALAGPVAVRRKATRLMGLLTANRWPLLRRQSRESALKSIAADSTIRPRVRLQAIEQLLFPAEPTPEEQAALDRLAGGNDASK